MRSSAVTTGDSLEIPPPVVTEATLPVVVVVVVQGSKSYIDVSISAKRTSSSARSERKPDGEEAEEGVSDKLPGGKEGKGSKSRSSACKTLAASDLGRESLREVEIVEILAAFVRVGGISSSISLTED